VPAVNRTLRPTRRLLGWLVASAIVVGACSSSDDDSTTDTTAPDATTTAPVETTTTAVPLPTAAAEDTSGDQTPPVGTNGIALDDDGRAWIADLEGDQVIQVDLDSGELLRRFPTPTDAGPDDLAIDDQGRVFWTGFTSGQVGRIDPATGEHVIVADVPPGANPIAISDDGRLFVGLAVTADGLYEIDPTGATAPRRMSDGLGNVNGFDVAADGMIYGPRATGELVRIDHESGEVLATVATDLGYGVSVREAEPGVFWFMAVPPSPRLLRIEVAAGASEGSRTDEVLVDSPIVDNFAIADDGTFVVTTFDRPVVVRVDPTTGESTELPLGTP
jgi:streptogramin lyase